MEEEIEVETLEFSLDDEEIDEFIELLKNLKESKDKFAFEIDEENEIVVHYNKDVYAGDICHPLK